jgi:excisionase family DNA binding protein
MADPSAKQAPEQPADSARPRYLAPPAGSAADTAPAALAGAAPASPWLTYAQAAAYTGWTVAYLRNLVSAGAIPVYGRPRVRRFRRDVLDEYLTDPDAAMRRFRAERNRHHGR